MKDDTDHPRPGDTDQAHKAFGPDSRFHGARLDAEIGSYSGVLFEQAMAQTRMAVCLTDPNEEDDPIVFANAAFFELTGYRPDEVIGKNCRILQGEDTDRATVARIARAIRDEDVIVVELLNYRKDGTPFWNALHLGPIYDAEGRLLYFFGSQWNVTDVHAARADERHARMLSRELSHRMKNMFSVISGIVMVTGRARGIEAEAAEINERIAALGRAYETTLDDAIIGMIEVGQMLRAVLTAYDPDGSRIRFLGNGVRVAPNVVSMLGLTMHELATNAAKHGALSDGGGHVEVDWRRHERPDRRTDLLELVWREHTGFALDNESCRDGVGSEIMASLLRAAEADVHREWGERGLTVRISVPVAKV